MSARRAVLLTLLAVFLVAVLALGGFLIYRAHDRYERAVDRGDRWKEIARGLDIKAAQVQPAYDRGYREGKRDAENVQWTRVGIESPGWYVVRMEAPNGALRPDGAEQMVDCRHYWIYSIDYNGAGTLGRSIDEPC